MTVNEQDLMGEVTLVGKVITINIEIVDRDKAQKLLATMYDKYVDELGVKVHEWGFYNNLRAEKIRLEKIISEIDRCKELIDYYKHESTLSLLEQDK